MGYFISGFKTSSKTIETFEQIFRDLVPSSLKSQEDRIVNKSSYFINYSGNKIISDLKIASDSTGSWLVILGTPLVIFGSKEQEQIFLNDFLANPSNSLAQKIDGNFGVFAYDAMQDRFIFASDFNNTTPIYYSCTSNGFLFSSHELPLARILKPEVDELGFYYAVHLGVTWGSRTRFRGISKTIPCQVIIIDNSKALFAEQYWYPNAENRWVDSFDQIIEKWISVFGESVWKYYKCSGQKPVMVDFTGGEDSRLILAQCNALGIPLEAHVVGSDDDMDVIIARRAAEKTGFNLKIRQKHWPSKEQLLANALEICLSGDAYKEFTVSCVDFATKIESPLDDYRTVLYCGVPGGEAFRGSYYLRGKAIFPSRNRPLDYRFFIKMKYLLDYFPGLLRYPDDAGIESIFEIVRNNLKDVEQFPIGIQIDHMLRVFQTGFLGLKYKNPLYLPFATGKMTRSIYTIPPGYKQGGKLTRACTEILYRDLAFIRTQKGIPTIRKTFLRLPLFMPEYFSLLRSITSGATSRLLKWTTANKWYYNQNRNSFVFETLFNSVPYSKWFSSAKEMKTGHLYNPEVLNSLLDQAKKGTFRMLPVVGRIINQELAFRWVYNED